MLGLPKPDIKQLRVAALVTGPGLRGPSALRVRRGQNVTALVWLAHIKNLKNRGLFFSFFGLVYGYSTRFVSMLSCLIAKTSLGNTEHGKHTGRHNPHKLQDRLGGKKVSSDSCDWPFPSLENDFFRA